MCSVKKKNKILLFVVLFCVVLQIFLSSVPLFFITNKPNIKLFTKRERERERETETERQKRMRMMMMLRRRRQRRRRREKMCSATIDDDTMTSKSEKEFR